MQNNTIVDMELSDHTDSETTSANSSPNEVLLGANKQQATAWIAQVLRLIKPENVTTELSSMTDRNWLKSTNNHNTIKYTRHQKNLITGNDRTVIKFFAKWDQQQQLHPTYNGPRTGNYLKRLKSNYQALLKTIEFYQQDYQLVNVEGLKFELEALYQRERGRLQKICKIDETMIVRAASSDKNAIDDFHTNHDNSLELIQKFNESAIFKIKQAHCQAISKKSILKKVKEMEITSVKTDEENPLHTDLIHIFPIIHNHKTMEGRKEQKIYWYLSTTIPLGTIYPTSDRALGEAGVTNFRRHLFCRINGDIKLDDFSVTSLTPLTQVIRHSAFPAIYEQDLDRKKNSHLEMIKRVNQKLAESHGLDNLENGAMASLKVMTLMLMTPYAAETLDAGLGKLVTPLVKKIPNAETRGIIDADHNIQLRGNESEVNQVEKSYEALSINPPLNIKIDGINKSSKTITVLRDINNSSFQLPVNLETTAGVKQFTKFLNPSIFIHDMVRAINHEGYFKLEQLFLQCLQAKIENIDSNKKLSQLDKLLVEYTQQLSNYTAEFELVYQQQDHKDYKKLTKKRQQIYQKFDPAFAKLRSGLIKHLDRITNLEDRKFAGILIEFINVQKLFANLLYDKTYSGQLAYDMMSRLAVIANWLDYYVEIFCKSSKDRSGMLTLLIESFEIFYDMLGHYPQLDNGNDISWLQTILNSSVIFYSTSKVVASLNSPGSEGLNQSHVPFLQEHARDYLHSIGKLSKKTWAIKFDKSDPHADKRTAVPVNQFLRDTHDAIEKFIDHIKLENGFAKAIDHTNTKLEALINYQGKPGQKLDEIKYRLPQLKQELIKAIKEFHAQTKNDNQAFEQTFEDLKNRLMSARYYSSNKAIFAGSDSKRACPSEFITQLKQLLAQVNEFRANNPSHGQNSKTIQRLNYNLALMVNILTHYKDTIRKEIEVLNYRESDAVIGWKADLAAHQDKSAPLTVPSSEDNGSLAEDAYQSDQEPADTQPLLYESSEEADSSQQVVTEHRTSQEYKNSIEEYIKDAVTSFDTARKKYIIDMERIDELLKGVDHLRQILIADWELRKFQQETYLVKVAITRFIERLPTTDELVDDEAKNWRDNVDKWATNTCTLIDQNEKEALTGSRGLFTAKQELQQDFKQFLAYKKNLLKSKIHLKSYPSCTEPFSVDKIKMQIKESARFLLPETTLKLEQALKNFADIHLIVQQKKRQKQLLSEQERLQFERAKATLEQLMTPLLQGQLPLEQRLFNLKQQVNKLLEQTATLGIEEEEEQTATLGIEEEEEQTATLGIEEEEEQTATLGIEEEEEQTATLGIEEEEEQTATLGGKEEENVKTLIKKLGELKLELICFRPGDSLTTNTELEFIRLEERITLLANKLQSFGQENVQQLTPAVEQAQQQVIEINQYRQTLNRKVEVLAKLADGSYMEDQITADLDNIPATEEQRQTMLLL